MMHTVTILATIDEQYIAKKHSNVYGRKDQG